MTYPTNIVKRMSLAVIAGLFATAVLAVVPAVTNPASASTPACPVAVTHPNISIYQQSRYVTYAITQTCGDAGALGLASWEMVGPGGWDDTAIFYPNGLYNTFYSWYEGKHLGRYTLHPHGAYNDTNPNLPQATETFYVKLASGIGISGYRSGNWVYLREFVHRYNPDLNSGSGGWQPSVGRKVWVQMYYNGAWYTKALRYTSTNGWTSYIKLYAPKVHYYRALVTETSTLWNATSPNIRR